MSRTHRKGSRAAKKTKGGARHAILDSGGHSHKRFKKAGGSYTLFEGGQPQHSDQELHRSGIGHMRT